MGNSEYKYKNIHLTPTISRDLILEIFNRSTVERKTIIQEIIKIHIERGGKERRAKDRPRMVKKALERLVKEGYATKRSLGYWQINNENKSDIIDIVPTPDEREHQPEKTKDDEVDIILGRGPSAVYLYYFPSYKKNREKDKDTWECKIGKTDRDPFQRISSQASTALPEKPKVAIIIKTDNAHALELAIHNILTYRKKNLETALGKEWFDTNPDEFFTIVQFISKSTLLF
ncbi:hypothetical protein AM500_18630 [Bacillus sp. FJAT-18017]|uniref:GIY-YIG nuclease family protein n=1 Tax=Bacillus sp. FJAT-18017 TaxID=1705566 RepID=UPI0006AF359F|nr:GIY-YIG nuclease family protein [Bacillus sp. FJAT-18017]ALC91576.1 hypothetical protein AM500_18630 [Bacillus sp. FJAT-18017]